MRRGTTSMLRGRPKARGLRASWVAGRRVGIRSACGRGCHRKSHLLRQDHQAELHKKREDRTVTPRRMSHTRTDLARERPFKLQRPRSWEEEKRAGVLIAASYIYRMYAHLPRKPGIRVGLSFMIIIPGR